MDGAPAGGSLRSRRVRLRLFVSYQRYAALLGALAVVLAALAWTGEGALRAGALVLAVVHAVLAALVARRWPHKFRVTATQDARIRRGRFAPADLAPWVEDPCYRVVSREILGRAGFAPAEARRLVRDLTRASERGPRVFFRRPDGPIAEPTGQADGLAQPREVPAP